MRPEAASSVQWEGVQSGREVKALLNTVPSEANQSILGVEMSALRKLNDQTDHWSVRINRMLFMISILSSLTCF